MTSSRLTAISVIARAGYVAKGFVYFLVGLLTLQATIGMGGQTTGTTQALQEIIYRPFGSVLLVGIILGLLAHAIWRMIQGILDPEDRDDTFFVRLFRVIDFCVGCLYISLSYAAWQILQGLNAQSSNESTEIWIGRILELPFGKWLVILIAVAILIGGLYQFYSAAIASFDYSFDTKNMKPIEKIILSVLGRIGIFSWGIVYCMVAYMLYRAAVTYDADQAGGLSEALNALRQQPYGVWILGLTASGLIIYGIYLLVLSYYHKVYDGKTISTDS